jgi:hypothetical protein
MQSVKKNMKKTRTCTLFDMGISKQAVRPSVLCNSTSYLTLYSPPLAPAASDTPKEVINVNSLADVPSKEPGNDAAIGSDDIPGQGQVNHKPL